MPGEKPTPAPVVASPAEPGIAVEVFGTGDLVGKVMAEASADWVLAPDRLLASATAKAAAGIASSNARSPHDVAIVIPADLPAPATIDAIDIDGSASYFAGAAPEGATVKLYVQNAFIAAAKVEGGRWFVEARGALTLPIQRVRIDVIASQQATVAARAEVNFVIDVPPPAPEMAIASTGSGAVAAPNSATGDMAFAPPVDSEREADPTIPTLRALPAVAPEMLRFASGKAIIRRGETLWAIAARLYGDGSLYPRIVAANAELRHNPGRIYPGQVFDLPRLQGVDALN